jgi:hypothetical protein
MHDLIQYCIVFRDPGGFALVISPCNAPADGVIIENDVQPFISVRFGYSQ